MLGGASLVSFAGMEVPAWIRDPRREMYLGPAYVSGSSPALGSFVSWVFGRVCICRGEGGGQLLTEVCQTSASL